MSALRGRRELCRPAAPSSPDERGADGDACEILHVMIPFAISDACGQLEH